MVVVVAQQTPPGSPDLSVDELVSALELRTSWTLMRKALKEEKLPIGLGWKDLKAHASETHTIAQRLRVFCETTLRNRS